MKKVANRECWGCSSSGSLNHSGVFGVVFDNVKILYISKHVSHFELLKKILKISISIDY